MASHNKHSIWQWNFRGHRRKRAVLQQLLLGKDNPDVIALQETAGMAKLSGYISFSTDDGRSGVTTLVRRNLAVVKHDTEVINVDHVLVELIPAKKKEGSLFVLNIYSSPKQRKARFGPLLQKTLRIAKRQALVVVGD